MPGVPVGCKWKDGRISNVCSVPLFSVIVSESTEAAGESVEAGNETSLWFAICLLMVHHLLRSHCGERTLLHPSARRSQFMSFSSATSSSAILQITKQIYLILNLFINPLCTTGDRPSNEEQEVRQ